MPTNPAMMDRKVNMWSATDLARAVGDGFKIVRGTMFNFSATSFGQRVPQIMLGMSCATPYRTEKRALLPKVAATTPAVSAAPSIIPRVNTVPVAIIKPGWVQVGWMRV